MPRPALLSRDRYPSGKAKPDTSDPVSRIRHIIAAARQQAPIMDGPIGRLHLLRELTVHHVAAAEHYAKARAAHDAADGLPRRTPASPAFEPPSRGQNDRGRDDAAAMRVIRRFETLAASIGPIAVSLLDRVVVCCDEPAWAEKRSLVAALELVAVSAGLSGGRRRS